MQMIEEREQMVGIQTGDWMVESKVHIFADITGYGKTATMIGVLCRDKMPWRKEGVTEDVYTHSSILGVYGNGLIVSKRCLRFQKVPCTLIVSNMAILHQWHEAITSSTTLRVELVKSRMDIHACKDLATEYDVVLCTSCLYNEWIRQYSQYAWKRVIYDEPCDVRIPNMLPVATGSLWLVTATPMILLFQQRSTAHFLSNLFPKHMDPSLFERLVVKNDDGFVRHSYDLPPCDHFQYQCVLPVYHLVRDVLSGPIMDMISAGDISGAVRMIGGASHSPDSTTSIYELILHERQERILECEMKIQRYRRLLDAGRMEKWRKRKEEAERDIDVIHRRMREMYQTSGCAICLSDTTEKPVLLSCCQNVFCGKCIFQCLHYQEVCPFCRKPVVASSVHEVPLCLRPPLSSFPATRRSSSPTSLLPIAGSTEVGPVEEEDRRTSNGNEEEEITTPARTKIQWIYHLIQEKHCEGRFIIFSCFDESFDLLRKAFVRDKMEFYELRGSNEQRLKALTSFRETSPCVLFLNTLRHGAGLNLQEATDLILFHRMPEPVQTQVVGRAQRIGRRTPLRIHHLLP